MTSTPDVAVDLAAKHLTSGQPVQDKLLFAGTGQTVSADYRESPFFKKQVKVVLENRSSSTSGAASKAAASSRPRRPAGRRAGASRRRTSTPSSTTPR